MVAIVNVSENYKVGLQEYEVRINRCVIARFTHDYKRGLATCLRKAAKAVEEQATKEELIACLPYLKGVL